MKHSELHVQLWQWLMDNPSRDKADWPGFKKFKTVANHCFACQTALNRAAKEDDYDDDEWGYNPDEICAFCPLDWPCDMCEHPESPYLEWFDMDIVTEQAIEEAYENGRPMYAESLEKDRNQQLARRKELAEQIRNMEWK